MSRTHASLSLENLLGTTSKSPKSEEYTSIEVYKVLSSEASNLVDPPVNPEIFCLLNGPTIMIEGFPPAFQTFLITDFKEASVKAL